MPVRSIIEGTPVLIVVDIQGGESNVDPDPDADVGIPLMPGYDAAMERAPS